METRKCCRKYDKNWQKLLVGEICTRTRTIKMPQNGKYFVLLTCEKYSKHFGTSEIIFNYATECQCTNKYEVCVLAAVTRHLVPSDK
jgi:hypothetical protein